VARDSVATLSANGSGAATDHDTQNSGSWARPWCWVWPVAVVEGYRVDVATGPVAYYLKGRRRAARAGGRLSS